MAKWVVVVVLVAFSVLYQGTISDVSIDCGADASYEDGNGIDWKTDEGFTKTGKNQQVTGADLPEQMNSLRFFTEQSKSCYTFSSPQTSYSSSSGKILIQAGFHYGNYDKRSKPPTFDLLLNGNKWATVVTDLAEPVLHEVIFQSKRENINVCVSRTFDDQFPFISSLQVWALPLDMYKDMNTNYAMFKSHRRYFGNEGMPVIRYPDDNYNRMWTPTLIQNSLVWPANFTYISEATTNDPPFVVTRNEVEAPRDAQELVLPPLDFPQTNRSNYVAFYFTEVFDFNSNDRRTFKIHIDDRDFGSTVSTEYQTCTVVSQNSTSSAMGPMTITLVSVEGSTLTPAISAIEVYTYSEILAPGTSEDDVEGLVNLASSFSQLNGWTGEPCLPSNTVWPWLKCSGDRPPRVTSLNLSAYGLKGSLPDFGQMTALEIIDLHSNTLTGPIPDFLGDLPNLKILNLAYNNFTGDIPESLSDNKKLFLNTTGNPNLHVNEKTSKRKRIFEVLAAVVVLIVITCSCICGRICETHDQT